MVESGSFDESFRVIHAIQTSHITRLDPTRSPMVYTSTSGNMHYINAKSNGPPNHL
ncbi:hypothetical protein K440DRAFT_618126 [Wilcoxina mikolae CBS 423.85]|nr:hypothetical protein K440DRAFT_618126 [Wilcoxina mikolae CBS 423.85]